MKTLTLLIIALSVISVTSCKTTGTRNTKKTTFETPKKLQTRLSVTALYSTEAVPFDDGIRPHLNFENLVSSDPKENEENTKIMSECFLALNELGHKTTINDRSCTSCIPVRLSVEFEDNGIKESTFLDCHPQEKGCTLFQKNYRKKIQFTLLDKNRNPKQTIISETTGRPSKVSDVAFEICKAGFEEFPEIRANKIYTLEKR